MVETSALCNKMQIESLIDVNCKTFLKVYGMSQNHYEHTKGLIDNFTGDA